MHLLSHMLLFVVVVLLAWLGTFCLSVMSHAACAGNISAFTCSDLTAGVEYTLRVDTFLNNSATYAVHSSTQTTITGMSHAWLTFSGSST